MTCSCRCHTYGAGTHVTCDVDGGYGVGCGPHEAQVWQNATPDRSDRACPGPCNRDHRANPAADITPVAGAPVWCEPCQERIRRAVGDLPAMYAQLAQDMAARSRLADLGSIRGSAGHPTPSPQVDLQDETLCVLLEIEDLIRAHRPGMAPRAAKPRRYDPSAGAWRVETLPAGIFGPPRLLPATTAPLRPVQTRRPVGAFDQAFTRTVQFVAAHLEWALSLDNPGRVIGDKVLRHHARLRAVTATGSGVSRRTQRCPRCDVRALEQEPGKDFLQCAECGRLVSLDEYDALVLAEQAGQAS